MLPELTLQLLFGLALALIILLFLWIFKLRKDLSDNQKSLQSSQRIYQIILEDLDFQSVVQKIADSIPSELRFGTGVVAIYDESKGTIKRIGASRTKEAQNAIKALSVPFDKIEISINDPNNLMAKSLRERKPFITKDSYDVLGPVLSREECKKIQEIMDTKTTLIYPIFLKDRPVGVFIASTNKEQHKLSLYELYVIENFVKLVGLVLQNSKLFTSLKETKDQLATVNKVVENINLQLNDANNKLKELDQLKDDFVSVASHELRTPMTAIRSYAWMALYRSDVPLSDKLKKYLSRTLISTERLINLVNEMLNISRIESGRVEIRPMVFDIKTLVQEVFDEVEGKAKEKNQHLEIKQDNIPKIFADPDKVHQVLLNLIGNSLKFTPNEGKITVSFFSDGVNAEISIIDTGTGISQDDLSRLFKKFGRLSNSYVTAGTTGGTGLGLYICKSLVERMGGKIKVTSAGVGHGTTFTFSLPIASKEILAHSDQYKRSPIGDAKGLEPVAL